MKTFKDVLIPMVFHLDDGKIRITMSVGDTEVAVLYFELPKKGWTNKPIMPTKWRCVDAQIQEKFIYIEGLVEPKDLVGWGQEIIEQVNAQQIPQHNFDTSGDEHEPHQLTAGS